MTESFPQKEARVEAAGETEAGTKGRKTREWDPFPTSRRDKEAERSKPATPQALSPTYRLAYADEDFLTSVETRGVRLQLEMMKPEMALDAQGILSTVVLFGGARIPEPGTPATAGRTEAQNRSLEAISNFYEEARRFASLASRHSADTSGGKEFVIVTGGGPGVMEAGNRGADDVGACSIALNITLPHEQAPNRFATPDLCFKFHYFAIRKMHFLLRAKAMAIFPGGFGTLDELFEALTLIQTRRMQRIPVVLFGRAFWERLIDLDFLAETGTIAPEDLDLITFAETGEEGWRVIRDFYEF